MLGLAGEIESYAMLGRLLKFCSSGLLERQHSCLKSPLVVRWLADDDFSCFGVRRPREHVGWKSYLYSTHTHKPYTRTSSRIGTRSTWPLNSTLSYFTTMNGRLASRIS